MMCKTQTERALLQRAEWAERRLMEIEHERLLEQEERRRQSDHDRQALAEAEQRRKADEEREQVRRGAWWDYLMDTSQPERFKKHVVDNQFDITKIKAQIPDDPAAYPPNFDLRARGITAPLDWASLRFHPSVYYRGSNEAPLEVWPALLAAVTDGNGRITGVQRTFLDPQQHAKAPLANPRRALGNLLGNGVHLGDAKHVVVAGEGVETVLALKSALPWLPMIAGLSANHLAAIDLAPAWRRLYIARDNDCAGFRAGEQLERRGKAAGMEVRHLIPLSEDFNADLRAHGAVTMRAMLRAHLLPTDCKDS